MQLKIVLPPASEPAIVLPMVEIMHPQFAANLRSAMEWQGRTVTDLARHLDITYEMARRYTLGTAKPRTKNMAKLAAFLGISPAMLEYGQPKLVSGYVVQEEKVEYLAGTRAIENNQSAIGDRGKMAREQAGKTQAGLAAACGLTQQALSKIESGSTESPGADIVAKIATHTGHSIEWLITGKAAASTTAEAADIPETLKGLFDEIRTAYHHQQLSPALVASLRSLIKALPAQQQASAPTQDPGQQIQP